MARLLPARLLAGPEHGRTIPLADIGGTDIPQCSKLVCAIVGASTGGVDSAPLDSERFRCTARCRCVGDSVEHDEIANRADGAGGDDARPGVPQLARVGLTFVTEYIVLGGDDENVGQPLGSRPLICFVMAD